MKANHLRHLLNIYPPYWGTGIVVKNISEDYREALVQMKMRWYNRNYVKSHFGGSLFAMTDPFYMLMLIHILGKKFIVIDKTAHIEFVKPGRGTVTADFKIKDEQIEDIIRNTSDGRRYYPEFSVDIKNGEKETVATVHKTLYIRRIE